MNLQALFHSLFQNDKDVASWVRSGVIGQPSYDTSTKEIIASKKNTSDVTSQVGANWSHNKPLVTSFISSRAMFAFHNWLNEKN